MTKVKDNKGGRPKLADYQKRTKLVRIMFCENDFIYILSKASKAGLSVSEYCHQAAMDNHIRETIFPELAKQIRDLSGIANNVNQIAHQMHIDGPDNEEGNALMAEIAKEWLKRMRIVNTQFIIARHHETKHPHCHIVYNIIDNDGNVLSDRNERYRSARICRALTEEYGLYIARKNSKEQNLNRLRPQQMKKAQLKTAVLDARQASNNWESFIAELSKRHIGMQTTPNKLTDKVVELSFSLDETHSAGSRLDSSLSYSNLCVFFGQALEDLIFLPHVQATECGGGPTNSQGWRDKDEDKDKWKLQQQTKYKPSKRRR